MSIGCKVREAVQHETALRRRHFLRQSRRAAWRVDDISSARHFAEHVVDMPNGLIAIGIVLGFGCTQLQNSSPRPFAFIVSPSPPETFI